MNEKRVGVVCGRFQVAEMSRAHIHMMAQAIGDGNNLLVIVSDHGGARTSRDPLTVQERGIMIESELYAEQLTGSGEFHLSIVKLRDNPLSASDWSKSLDDLIQQEFPGASEVVGFFEDPVSAGRYSGQFNICESDLLEEDMRPLGALASTGEKRAAIIHSVLYRRPQMYATADIAILDEKCEKVLLIRKKHHGGAASFPGGHVDKGDGSGIGCAEREGQEELKGIRFSILEELGSFEIDDPRYEGTPDGIMTSFVAAAFEGGDPVASDDADGGWEWTYLKDLSQRLVPWHQKLGEQLIRWAYED